MTQAFVFGAVSEADFETLLALRGSDANRFYLRHGFTVQAQTEWDIAYERPADTVAG